MTWEGPHRIGEYLGRVAQSQWKRPPEASGIYIVSEKPWREFPAEADRILYVGPAVYLRYEVGRLMCDLLGFTGDNPSADEAYQHKGGHSLWSHYCLPQQIEPTQLYLGWCAECRCIACAETKLLEMMSIGPHRIRICPAHRPAMDLKQNCQGVISTPQNFNGGRHH